MNYGFLNMLGKENSKWFVANFYYVCGLPLTCCGISIFLMLASSLISIGGIYHSTVWYFVLIIGGIALIIIQYFYYYARKKVLRHLRAQVYHKQQSQTQHSVTNLSLDKININYDSNSPRSINNGAVRSINYSGSGGGQSQTVKARLTEGTSPRSRSSNLEDKIDIRLQQFVDREKNRISQYAAGNININTVTSVDSNISNNDTGNVGIGLTQRHSNDHKDENHDHVSDKQNKQAQSEVPTTDFHE